MSKTPETSTQQNAERTENEQQARRTADRPTRRDGTPMRMKDMDHAPPVEGPNRTFERANEGRPPRTDGGPRTGSGDAGGRFRQKMKEMDHTPPTEGARRTFERGSKADDGASEHSSETNDEMPEQAN